MPGLRQTPAGTCRIQEALVNDEHQVKNIRVVCRLRRDIFLPQGNRLARLGEQ
jgi:hypothetical protein